MVRRTRRNYRKSRKRYPRVLRANSLHKPLFSGFPAENRTILRYVDHDALQSSTGIWDFCAYRANGIFDPNYTLAGHQPLGYDQWATYYNHYVVNSCRFKVTFTPTTTAGTPCACSVYLGDDASTPYAGSTYYALAEANRGQQKILSYAAAKPVVIRGYYSAKKFFNVKDIRDNLDRIGSGIGASPAEGAIFYAGLQSMDLGSTSNVVLIKVELEYDVTFSEPKDLTQS